MTTNAARLGERCPLHGCGAKITERHGFSRSVICEKGHWLVDRDAPPAHGVQQISPRQREVG